MKKIAWVTALLCVSGCALAADAGLGVSVRSSDTTIYLPINASETFRIEPMLQYLKDSSEERILPDTPYTVSANADTTVWIVGVGLFGVKKLADSASVYYGARVGYQSVENELSYVGTLPPGAVRPPSTSDKFDGFVIAPTIGLEYHFSKHFSIGGEAALKYETFDGDDTNEETTSTSTNIIFRYMF